MIGKPRTLISFNKDIVRQFGLFDHKIDADNGNADCSCSLACCANQVRVDGSGHIMDRTPYMKIGGLPHRDLAAVFQNGFERQPLLLKASFRFRIDGNTAFSTGRRSASTRLYLDKLADGCL